MFKRPLITFIAAIAATSAAIACTSLIATPGATADNSVMITYAADSHNLYGELYSKPAADHAPGAMREVRDWDTGRYLGEIPEISHTYATVGNMNEHGLAISESTWGGHEELVDTTGIIDYGSLIYITLERAKTAREAIKVMTDLVNKYGYASSGESFSIADGKEAWIMELIGKGSKEKGAVWVARRIPDGMISGHANHPRIHKFPLDDPETLYSPDVIDFARKQGYYKGKDKDFDFSLAYAVTDFGALRGCDARVWSFFNRHASGMDKYLQWINEGDTEAVMPLWVKPDSALTVRDMQWAMRDHFEDTPFDMTQDIGAGPFKVPYRWRPMTFTVDGTEYTHERAIATQQTGFTFVAQLRDQVPAPMKGILWFGVDDANTCVYVPIYCCVTEVPYCYAHGNGDMLTLSWDAAFWVHNYVANQAYNRYSQMIPDIRRVQNSLEDAMEQAVAETEAQVMSLPADRQRRELSMFSDYWANRATREFKQLGDYLFVKYLDGNIKKETSPGVFKRTPEGQCEYPQFGGYSDEYFRSVANDAGERLKVKQPEKIK
ncbi:MAG TPA: C69 family dipeptidase [Muribaculum sp.]|uniref:dipeptidase n=1 Tax=Heminiphilus faecis TaxID=2601703 RepID=UPI000EF587A0|nr:C69 family dipeptidase [Heminiphilus faecis]RLT77241.1 dipeptidase [bacterium J10(2018)]HRF68459.1 C69 family dipeptidase [Muribaculum sp.]